MERLDILIYLASQLIRPDIPNEHLKTSIYHYFASRGCAVEMLICIKMGVDPDLRTPKTDKKMAGANALHIAAR
jgi:hypothetical protein